MASYKITHGATIEVPSVLEIAGVFAAIPKGEQLTQVRVTESGIVKADGIVTVDVYQCPLGYEFFARRIFIDESIANGTPNGGTMIGANSWVTYMRSGTRIGYALLANSVDGFEEYGCPGVETWGDQQGPMIRNGEVFQVKFTGFPVADGVTVALQGILRIIHDDRPAGSRQLPRRPL